MMQRPVAGDFWGGLSAAAVILPQAMAFGVTLLAALGLPAASGALSGLIAASLLCFCSGLAGGARGLISSPTGPLLILLGGTLGSLAAQGLDRAALLPALAALVMLSGLFQILIGLSGGGRLIKFIPYPVISGFMTGSAILMLLSQRQPLAGPAILESGSFAWLPAATAAATALAMWWVPRRFSAVPGTIAGLVVGTAFFHLAALPASSALPQSWVIGAVPSLATVQLPLSREVLTALPWQLLLLPALALAVLGSLNTLIVAVIADVSTSSRHRSGVELAAQGTGNLLSGLLGGMAASGTTGATLIAVGSGGGRWAGAVAGSLLLLLLLVGRQVGTLLPVSVLSGIILFVALRMLDRDIIAWLRQRQTRGAAGIALFVTAVTVFYDLVTAVAAGVAIAIIMFIRSQALSSVVHLRSSGKQLRSVRKRSEAEDRLLSEHGDDIVLYELRGNLIFATTDALLDRVGADLDSGKSLILHLRRVQQIDLTAARLLQQLANRLHKHGGELLVCNLYREIGLGELAEQALREFSHDAAPVPILTFNGKDEALEHAENRLLQRLGHAPGSGSERKALGETDLCQKMTPQELAALQAVMKPHHLAAGSLVFESGTPGASLFLVLQGEIEIRLPTTRHHYKRLATCQSGTWFGELALLSPGPRVATAIALQDSELLELDAAGLETLRRDNPQAAVRLLMTLARIEVAHLRWTTRELQHLSEW